MPKGFGNIRELPSGRYQARVEVDGRSVTIGTFDTEPAARLALDERQDRSGAASDPDDQLNLAFGVHVNRYIRNGDFRTRTNRLYRRLAAEYINAPLRYTDDEAGAEFDFQLGDAPLRDVSRDVIRTWWKLLSEETTRRALARHSRDATGPRKVNAAIREWARETGILINDTGRISPATRVAWETATGGAAALVKDAPVTAGRTEASQAYRLVHSVLSRAVEDDLIATNPCRIRQAGGGPEPDEIRPATPEQVFTMVGAMPRRYRAAPLVAATSAMRHEERFALARRHYDPETREVNVERALEPEGSKRRFTLPKTKGSKRVFKLPEIGAIALEAHMEEFTGPDPDDLIFTTANGTVVYTARLTAPWQRARRAAGRPDLDWHDLRHTGATLAAMGGATLREVQDLLGHSTVRAAVRYQQRADGSRERTAASIDRLWKESRPPRE